MSIEVTVAGPADYRIVSNLARFYIYDMAEHTGWHFPSDGLFDSEDQFARYWNLADTGKHAWPREWRGFPFVIRIDGHPAGFALIKRLSEQPPAYDMGEFFVARQYRRKGIGQRVAVELFDSFPGQWEVREMPSNGPAQEFWRRVIAGYTNGVFTETRERFAAYGGREFIVQRFQSKNGAATQECRA
ncbi:MAG TPA: GNAT family N-acetyltransferase [Bryobacteraceae bacterium]|nr:GNAT family N-acetyltransferase [Bryobacteraceae bacterium]